MPFTSPRLSPRRSLSLVIGALAASAGLVAQVTPARADSAPKAEVLVIHATKCDKKSVDPRIGEAPPALGYDCLELLEKKTMPLALNKASTTPLPNGRTFQLLHTSRVDQRYKVSASISAPDKSGSYVKLADITADPNKPFNVGGFTYRGGVLLLTVRIVP